MKWFLVLSVILPLYSCTFDISNTYDLATPTEEHELYLEAYDRSLSLWPVPFKELTIETGFGNAHLIVSGPEDAPPVVLLHGMNASSTMWYPNIEELSRDHKVYAIDNLTEPGKSEMARPVKNIEELVSWYIEIMDKLQINQFTLIGASKGGWLAVNLAIRLRNRVEKLILLSPLQTFGGIPPGTGMFSVIRYALDPKRKHLEGALNNMSTNVAHIDSLYINQFLLGSRISEPGRLLRQFTPYSRKDFRKLKMPVLVLIGDQDIINKKSAIDRAGEFIPRAETAVIPDAGHFLSMDQTELTNNKILEFLNAENLTAF